MAGDPQGCGPLHELYTAARMGDSEGMAEAWKAIDSTAEPPHGTTLKELEAAVVSGDGALARRPAGEFLFECAEETALDGLAARLLGFLLHGFGYLASFVLFFRAHSAQAVVRRLRWAYRTVGVDIRDTETVDGMERTLFRCPYRNLGADRYGQRRVCHDVLDRVDDGYVTFLDRHRGIDYQRPRACRASECCYSEVVER